MGRKGKRGVARSMANGAVAAEAGATKTRQDETKADASASSPPIDEARVINSSWLKFKRTSKQIFPATLVSSVFLLIRIFN